MTWRKLFLHLLLLVPLTRTAAGDAIQRMQLPKLQATHEAVLALKPEWKKVEIDIGLTDYRAILHCHSKFSHDSRGTIERVVEAAKAVGVNILMFNEHPADHYDYVLDGHQGMKDGVLLIPGAESGGFLAFPRRSLKGIDTSSPQEFADLVLRNDGLVFLSHLEERMDWEIIGMTGTEIYNTHADVKEENRLMFILASPLSWPTMRAAIEKYPQEFFASLQDYPKAYLRRWDELCQKSPLTGVAANDAHENIGIIVRLVEADKIRIEDVLGEKVIAELNVAKIPLFQEMIKDKKPGDIAMKMQLDPYERSLHHVSTHLLMPALDQDSVWKALRGGNAYVAFDWMADPTGFVFQLEHEDDRYLMGSRLPLDTGAGHPWKLRVAATLPCTIKIVKDGIVVHEVTDRSTELEINEPGIYRTECWLDLAGEARPWILSNPIYVRPLTN